MTYEAEEEKLPSLEEAKNAVEAEKWELETGEEVRTVGEVAVLVELHLHT